MVWPFMVRPSSQLFLATSPVLGLLFSAVRKFWKLSARDSLMAKQRDKAAAGIPSQFFNHLAVKKLAAIA
jgi:hypothetical protein